MSLIKIRKKKEIFVGMMKDPLVRLGTRSWSADFRLNGFVDESTVKKYYEKIVDNDASIYEAADLLNAKIIDFEHDADVDFECDEVEYRWDVVKYHKNGRIYYRRRGEEKILDEYGHRL